MKDEDFKKMDDEWMKKMKPLRERPVNPKLLHGFSASVERRIQANQEPAKAPASFSGFRVAVPVLAVCALAWVMVARVPSVDSPSGQSAPAQSAMVMEVAQVPTSLGGGNEAELTQEIEDLRELGAWTNDDEAAVGVSSGEEEDIADILG